MKAVLGLCIPQTATKNVCVTRMARASLLLPWQHYERSALFERRGWRVHPHDCCGSITKVHPSDCHHESSALLVQIATPVVAIAATDKRDNAALV